HGRRNQQRDRGDRNRPSGSAAPGQSARPDFLQLGSAEQRPIPERGQQHRRQRGQNDTNPVYRAHASSGTEFDNTGDDFPRAMRKSSAFPSRGVGGARNG